MASILGSSLFNSEQLGSAYLVKLELDNSNENIDIMSGFPEVQKKQVSVQ